MSICGGIAGTRGRNPVGIFIHNDAGGQFLNVSYWANALASGGHDLNNGFAHAYAGDDGVIQVEDDANCAYHCGQSDGNMNYLSIEACQSMGDAETFLANEERALQWSAQKCKLYGIVPNEQTIRLHQEVYATACPHRSVELHGGAAATKAYFIKRITEIMSGGAAAGKMEGEKEMRCFYTIDGGAGVYYFDGFKVHALTHPDELKIINEVYKANNGKDMPSFKWTKKAPWYKRLIEGTSR